MPAVSYNRHVLRYNLISTISEFCYMVVKLLNNRNPKFLSLARVTQPYFYLCWPLVFDFCPFFFDIELTLELTTFMSPFRLT